MNKVLFERTLPKESRYPFPSWLSSDAEMRLLSIDINNPEMKEFPKTIKGDTGMLLRIIFTAFQKVREGGARNDVNEVGIEGPEPAFDTAFEPGFSDGHM